MDGVQNYTCDCASFTEDGVLNYYTGRNCGTGEEKLTVTVAYIPNDMILYVLV